MNYRIKLLEIEQKNWPEPVKHRATELLRATLRYKQVQAQLKGRDLLAAETPALLMEAGRLLQRLGEAHKALAADVAYHITVTNSAVELAGGKNGR